VGRVGDELLLPRDVHRHGVEEPVDRGRQLVEFVAGAAQWQAVVQSCGAQSCGGVEDRGDRSGGLAREPVADERRHQAQQRPHRQQRAHQAREAIVEPGRVRPYADVEGRLADAREPQPDVAVRPNLCDELLTIEVARRE
jgi:hypothetical protein